MFLCLQGGACRHSCGRADQGHQGSARGAGAAGLYGHAGAGGRTNKSCSACLPACLPTHCVEPAWAAVECRPFGIAWPCWWLQIWQPANATSRGPSSTVWRAWCSTAHAHLHSPLLPAKPTPAERSGGWVSTFVSACLAVRRTPAERSTAQATCTRRMRWARYRWVHRGAAGDCPALHSREEGAATDTGGCTETIHTSAAGDLPAALHTAEKKEPPLIQVGAQRPSAPVLLGTALLLCTEPSILEEPPPVPSLAALCA